LGTALDGKCGSGVAPRLVLESAAKVALPSCDSRERTLLQNDYCAQDAAQTISGFTLANGTAPTEEDRKDIGINENDSIVMRLK
jgi:hypothetical protein